MGLTIRVINKSSSSIQAFVSKYSEGDDNWFPLAPQASDTWGPRDGWELVAFRLPNSGISPPRAGRYIDVRRVSLIEFHSWEDIREI